MSAHTPGPWGTNSKYGTGKRIPIVRAGASDREALAWVDSDDVSEEESQANVALIVAAPAMYEEHQKQRGSLTVLRRSLGRNPDPDVLNLIDEMIAGAAAVISKAEGA